MKEKNPAAVALSARRMIVLTPAQRTAIARHAAKSRMTSMTRAQRQAVSRAALTARWGKARATAADQADAKKGKR